MYNKKEHVLNQIFNVEGFFADRTWKNDIKFVRWHREGTYTSIFLYVVSIVSIRDYP